MIEILVQNGADVHHTNREGYPALIFAAKHGNLKGWSTFYWKYCQWITILLFCLAQKDITSFLIRKDANVNHSPNDGNTALLWAAISGNVEGSELPNCQTRWLIPNLIFYIGSKEIMDILIKKGADIHHSARDGNQALIYAAKHGKLECGMSQ